MTPSLAGLFSQAAPTFAGSPLYQALCPAIAADEVLLKLAAQCPPGHRPPNALFGATHLSVLRNPDSELAQWYVSVVGADAVRDPAEAPPVFAAYCRKHYDSLAATIRARLVQTNVVKRAAALRLGLAAVARRVDRPVALVEVGCSAGVLLCHDRYAYAAAGQKWGRRHSPVLIDLQWRSDAAPPDLDAIPIIDSTVGIDLHPIESTDPEERAWLEALVWPENRHEAGLLHDALVLVGADPPRLVAGDARDVLPTIGTALPADQPVVVFHSAARAHVPIELRAGFDSAIDDLAGQRPLFHLSLEGSREERFAQYRGAFVLQLAENAAEPVAMAVVEQHGEWILPL